MKAITIHQPWATLIAIGAKRFETRSWEDPYRGPIAIHAGRNTESLSLIHKPPFSDVLSAAGITSEEDLPLGCIVCIATLEDCLSTNGMVPMSEPEASFGNFGPDRFMWKLSNPQQFNPPIPARGYQKLWDWEPPKPSQWWVETAQGGICVFGTTPVDVTQKCENLGRRVIAVRGTLPYPSSPQLNPEENPYGCPPFCHSPRQCVGRGSCPKSYACSE